MKKKYFGHYPLVNILVSKMIFAAIAYRRKCLLRKSKKTNQVGIKFVNDESSSRAFKTLLGQGYDKLNLGGGIKNLQGFINIDFIDRPGVKRKIVANVHDLSFIPDKCISQIHSNHVVEHFSHEQFSNQLKQYKRVLKDDGILTLRCPNALGVCYGFFFGAVSETGHDDFLQRGYPADEEFYNPEDGWYHKDLWGLFHWLWAYPGNAGNSHLAQYTPTEMKEKLTEGGFEIIKMSNPETSNIVVIAKPVH